MTEELSERVETVYADVYAYPLALALLLLIVETLVPEASARRRSKLPPPPPPTKPRERRRRKVEVLATGMVAALLLPALVGGCERANHLFERDSPQVHDAIDAIDAGDAGAAVSLLQEYLSTGKCENGNIGTPSNVRERPNAAFDLGLGLFKIAERFGRRFEDAPVERDGGLAPAEEADLAKRSAEVECALRIVRLTAGDPSVPIELRARAFYLAGNLEFLRHEYKDAVTSYDASLRLVPGLPEDAGDGIGRDAAYNRAIALRRIEDSERDAGPPDASPDASPDSGPNEDGEDSGTPDAGNDQGQDGGADGGGEQDSNDGGGPPDAGEDGGGQEPQNDKDQRDEKQQQPSVSQDERLLDQLENAPTFQEHDARRAAARGRATMEEQMTARMTLASSILVATVLLVVARAARAEVSIQTGVSARKVELGQSLQFQIVAMDPSGQTTPQDPDLPAPPGVEVRGPSVGTQTQVSINNGRMTQSIGISATWTLIPRRVGMIRVGPATVNVGGGRRARSAAETIEVVPQGSLPRSAPRRFDPFSFDPFGGTSPFPQHPFLQPDGPEDLPPVPEEYRVEQAPDPIAFLRAVATPKRPVVGEQVTLRIYAYGGRGRFAESNATEPSRADFLMYATPDAGIGEQAVRVRIGEQEFIAQKIMEIALFPLHSGACVIGPMSMTFQGPGYRGRTPIVRKSERLVLEVEEPPLRGRPPGYKLGDVGELELSARVDPLRIVAGDGVSVVAKLSGTGNVPASLVVPQRRGVEWLEPSTTEDVDAKGANVKGLRVFTYVVKLHEPGRIDLGELTLPYFDPRRRTYAVARAALGTVQVDPNPASPAASSGTSDGAPSAKGGGPSPPAARSSLSAYVPPAPPFTNGLGFWALLLGAPLVVLLAGAGLELGKRAAERLKSRRTDPDRLATDALREADEAARTGRALETAGAVERALFRAIEAGTGLKARALLRAELESALAAAGVAPSTVSETVALLDACETLRFTEAQSQTAPKALANKARVVAGELARKRRRR